MTAWLTQKDVEDYGPDVLDLAQRAAMHAVTPELQRINDQNESLRRQLAQEQRRALYQCRTGERSTIVRSGDNGWRSRMSYPATHGNSGLTMPWQKAMRTGSLRSFVVSCRRARPA